MKLFLCLITVLLHIVTVQDQPVTAEGVHSVSSCLQLLRNLLHIPEVRGGAPGGGASHQNQIIWNLFTQQFDRVNTLLKLKYNYGLF